MRFFKIQFLHRVSLALVSSFCIASCAPKEILAPNPAREDPASGKFHLGNHSFPISTAVPEAQAAFNRGLILNYSFSHIAAEREFRRAAELDPRSPMPWWGVALVNGPHINFPLVPDDKAKVAWDALVHARQRRANGSALEKDLIDALGSRYAANQPEDRSKLDSAYADSMREVWARHPDNADIATLYAESLMDLHPWDLWEGNGTPKHWTPHIISTLERAMALNDAHPGAHHLYIHAVEASNAPERGVPSAELLRTLVPASGHMVHMPSHIFVRVGRLADAAKSNEDAILADAEFKKANPRQGFYAIYMLHNQHFLSFVRMMQGRRVAALAAAREMIAQVPPEFLRDFGPIADGYMATVPEVLMRFGQWNEILAEPEPAESLPLARAMWRFTRVSALTALDRRKEAKEARAKFVAAAKLVPKDATFGNNNAQKLLKIALFVMDGEMKARESQYDAATNLLKKAVRLEDSLLYDEPPDWILPVRHTLGATLLKAKRYKEAEKVYREDLRKFPMNGWSLYGLSRALAQQGRHDEAHTAQKDFEREWAGADTEITASCLCQTSV